MFAKTVNSRRLSGPRDLDESFVIVDVSVLPLSQTAFSEPKTTCTYICIGMGHTVYSTKATSR